MRSIYSFFVVALVSVVVSTAVCADDEDVMSILDAKDSAAVTVVKNIDSKLIGSLRREIGSPNPEQNIFLSFLKEGNTEKALYQWVSAFRGDRFSKTATGQALFSYLLFRNGMTVVAVENLFRVQNPEAISNEVVALWREVAPASHNVWGLAQVNWADKWSKTFDLATEVRVRGRNFSSVENIEPIVELLKKTTVNSPERAWLEWQIALGMALKGDIGKSAKVLKHLQEATNNRVTDDHINITAARLLFQNGYLDPAISYYQKVPKDSDFWLEAQEELGWTYIRKGEPQNTLAVTQTITSQVFENQVGPEAIFLHSLAQLKICDYPSVVQTLNMFKVRFRPKAANLVELAKTGVSEQSQTLVEKMKNGRPKLADLGSAALFLPRLASRDEILFDLVQTQKALEQESKTAGELYARSLSGGTAQVGFQAGIEELRKVVENRAQSAKSASFNRVKALAESELNEFQQILQKLHIVEAEVIQQITQAEKVIQASAGRNEVKKGTTGSKSKDQLTFPYEGETWFDELSNYRVSVAKGCQAGK